MQPFLFLRHGQSTANRDGTIAGGSTDAALTELGEAQARGRDRPGRFRHPPHRRQPAAPGAAHRRDRSRSPWPAGHDRSGPGRTPLGRMGGPAGRRAVELSDGARGRRELGGVPRPRLGRLPADHCRTGAARRARGPADRRPCRHHAGAARPAGAELRGQGRGQRAADAVQPPDSAGLPWTVEPVTKLQPEPASTPAIV